MKTFQQFFEAPMGPDLVGWIDPDNQWHTMGTLGHREMFPNLMDAFKDGWVRVVITSTPIAYVQGRKEAIKRCLSLILKYKPDQIFIEFESGLAWGGSGKGVYFKLPAQTVELRNCLQ